MSIVAAKHSGAPIPAQLLSTLALLVALSTACSSPVDSVGLTRAHLSGASVGATLRLQAPSISPNAGPPVQTFSVLDSSGRFALAPPAGAWDLAWVFDRQEQTLRALPTCWPGRGAFAAPHLLACPTASGEILLLDLQGGAVLKRFPPLPDPNAHPATPDVLLAHPNTLLVLERTAARARLLRLSPSNAEVLLEIQGPFALDADPTHGLLLLTHGLDLHLLSLAPNSPVRSLRFPGSPNGCARLLTPRLSDAGRLATVLKCGALETVDLIGQDTLALLPAWHSNRATILEAGPRERTVVLEPVSGLLPRGLYVYESRSLSLEALFPGDYSSLYTASTPERWLIGGSHLRSLLLSDTPRLVWHPKPQGTLLTFAEPDIVLVSRGPTAYLSTLDSPIAQPLLHEVFPRWHVCGRPTGPALGVSGLDAPPPGDAIPVEAWAERGLRVEPWAGQCLWKRSMRGALRMQIDDAPVKLPGWQITSLDAEGARFAFRQSSQGLLWRVYDRSGAVRESGVDCQGGFLTPEGAVRCEGDFIARGSSALGVLGMRLWTASLSTDKGAATRSLDTGEAVSLDPAGQEGLILTRRQGDRVAFSRQGRLEEEAEPVAGLEAALRPEALALSSTPGGGLVVAADSVLWLYPPGSRAPELTLGVTPGGHVVAWTEDGRLAGPVQGRQHLKVSLGPVEVAGDHPVLDPWLDPTLLVRARRLLMGWPELPDAALRGAISGLL